MKKILSIGLIVLSSTVHADDALRQQAKTMFGTLPKTMPGSEKDTPALINLGKILYIDKRLSANNTQSCNTCHNVDKSGPGVDNKATSTGALGKKGSRNSPTVWNAGFQFSQFWDGRANDLVAQAKGPILNPVEMATPDEAALEKKLQATKNYPPLFKAAFGADKQITYNNIAIAIAAFERTLITKDRFDDFINGNDKALSAQEQKGLQAFISNGCGACHNGPTLGGKMFQKLGMVNAYADQKDLGRFSATQTEVDRMIFKVPILRDVGRTAPYFHNGSVKTLDEAVRQMAWLQLGRKLDNATVADITAFLKSMNNKK